MATKTLIWTPNITANVTGQRAYKRQKSVGGAFLTTGFSPANDLSTAATTTQATGLLDNEIYEFQVANLCTVGGPTFNNNGIQEGIEFSCVPPTETHTDTSITATVSGLTTSITKVRFTLFDSLGVTLLQGPIDVVVSAGIANNVFIGLTASTGYIVRTELIAVVNGVEVSSSAVNCQIGVTTNAPVACPAPTGLTIS